LTILSSDRNSGSDHFVALIEVVDLVQQIYATDWHRVYLSHGGMIVQPHQLPIRSSSRWHEDVLVFIRADVVSRITMMISFLTSTRCGVDVVLYDGPYPVAPLVFKDNLSEPSYKNVTSTTFQATLVVTSHIVSCKWFSKIHFSTTNVQPMVQHRLTYQQPSVTINSISCTPTVFTADVFSCTWLVSGPPSSHLKVRIHQLNMDGLTDNNVNIKV